MGSDKGQQGEMPRSFDSVRQGTLVAGAGAAFTPRHNFTPVRYIRPKFCRVFIIDDFDFITAE
jgi:hypothetical protein